MIEAIRRAIRGLREPRELRLANAALREDVHRLQAEICDAWARSTAERREHEKEDGIRRMHAGENERLRTTLAEQERCLADARDALGRAMSMDSSVWDVAAGIGRLAAQRDEARADHDCLRRVTNENQQCREASNARNEALVRELSVLLTGDHPPLSADDVAERVQRVIDERDARIGVHALLWEERRENELLRRTSSEQRQIIDACLVALSRAMPYEQFDGDVAASIDSLAAERDASIAERDELRVELRAVRFDT